jgi:hypothetical protein
MRRLATIIVALVAVACVSTTQSPTEAPTASATAIALPPSPTAAVATAAPPAGLLEFHAPTALRGDWVFAIKAGIGVAGGRSVPSMGELWAVPLAGGSATLVARYVDWSDGSELRANRLRRQLSSDGKRLILSGATLGGRFVISLIDLDTSTVSTIAHDPAADLIRPALSPDGSRVAYVKRTGERDDGLWLVNIDGTGTRQLRPGVPGLYTWTYGWTPDSKGLAFDQIESAPSYVLLDVGTAATSSALGFGKILWGDQVSWRAKVPSLAAALADRGFNGEYRIVVADGADGPTRVLVTETNRNLILDDPTWNPMSDLILYRRLITVRQSEYYVIPAAGGTPQRIPLSMHAWHADWTPDGTGVVYLAQDTSGNSWLGTGVRVANRDGSADREILAMPDGGLSDLVAVSYR